MNVGDIVRKKRGTNRLYIVASKHERVQGAFNFERLRSDYELRLKVGLKGGIFVRIADMGHDYEVVEAV